MIKGIYNENEFYTNFYWDNKFFEDLRSKTGADASADSAVGALKGLDSQFWALKELPEGDPKYIEELIKFYESLFRALGYDSTPSNHQTSSGQFLSLFAEVRQAGAPELLAMLVGKSEFGAFESTPLFVGSDAEPVDVELSEIIQNEFQDSQNPPRWILVGAPNALFLIERNKWSFGRYLRIDWQEVFLQRDAKPYVLLAGIASKKILCPDAGSSPHDEFDENSHRHAFEVTTELRESVREAIELLINEMISLKKESHQKIYSTDSSDQYAKELTHDALYYVYRLLFLLYLEAQGEDSELLPLKSEIYRNGYSLEKLLELDFVEVTPDSGESKGTFLFESLDQIFNLIFFGFEPKGEGIFRSEAGLSGFLVKGIKSDLFNPSTIKHLKGVKIRNGVLLEILKKLSLTRKRERGGKPRARVSYANLGINQLGAVYEGLLSYTGFFAQEDLHALKPADVKQAEIDSGTSLERVYLASKSVVEKYRKSSEKKYRLTDENVVFDDHGNPKVYKKGSFIYRLAGRDRQKHASYYTPESLTKCTVKYACNVLFQSKGSLDELWSTKILEPAMGSGAFLNEAVNQLADRILELELKQGSELRTPKAKQKRLWDIKYSLIAKNIYGVDLNATAIELARFSLWLNCVGAGKEPPSFDGRLKVGNSLIGARFKRGADGIFPWLVLDEGIMNYGKRLKEYDSEAAVAIQEFRKSFLSSKLASSDSRVRSLQEKAELIYKQLCTEVHADKRSSAFERLKTCADIWCSLFFIDESSLSDFPRNHSDLCEIFDDVLENNKLETKLREAIEKISARERFFHWEIEFPDVLSERGFDLILGNPPWVAVDWQDSLYLSDYNVIPALMELNAAQTREFIETHGSDEIRAQLGHQFIRYSGYAQLLETEFYGDLRGVQKNTYKAFDVLALFLMQQGSVAGLIHEDGIYDDEKANTLRSKLYQFLKFHFQFQNEFKLFSEVHNAKRYSINIFQMHKGGGADFVHIGNLFIPATIDQCFLPSTDVPVPLIKKPNGEWETAGHSSRVIPINESVLKVFAKFNNSSEESSTPLLNLHSKELLTAIEKIGSCKETLQDYFGKDNCVGSAMFDESGAQDDGILLKKNGRPESSSECVISGPNIGPANPLFQETREEYVSNKSYDAIDLPGFPDRFLPRTLYKFKKKPLPSEILNFNGKPYWHFFRLATRGMVNAANERTLFCCIIPPGVSHINGIKSVAISDLPRLAVGAGLAASIVYDGIVKIQNKSNIFPADILGLPFPSSQEFLGSVARRSLALNALTVEYEQLWEKCACHAKDDFLASGETLSGLNSKWTASKPLRTVSSRVQAMVELDVLSALSLGLSFEELCLLYEVLFPVLVKYDQQNEFNRLEKMRAAWGYFSERGW